MTYYYTNVHDLQIGDSFNFTNETGFNATYFVTRMTKSSCWIKTAAGTCDARNSWNTINELIRKFDATIMRAFKL